MQQNDPVLHIYASFISYLLPSWSRTQARTLPPCKEGDRPWPFSGPPLSFRCFSPPASLLPPPFSPPIKPRPAGAVHPRCHGLQGSVGSFCRGTEIQYSLLCGPKVSVTTTQLCHSIKGSHSRYADARVPLGSSETLLGLKLIQFSCVANYFSSFDVFANI